MELAVSETRLGVRRIFTGIVRDITEYKKALAERTRLVVELGAERALLNSLLDNAPGRLRLFRPGSAFPAAQPRTRRDERPADRGPSRPHRSPKLLPLTLAGDAPRHFRRGARNPARALSTWKSRARPPRWPGQQRSLAVQSSIPSRRRTETMLGAGAVVTDIDDRKRMEEALKDADQRKDQFLAMLAHELRNPLAPISNAVQIMRVEGPERHQLSMVDRGDRRPDQAHDANGRRPARRLADHSRQSRSPEGADRAGRGRRAGRPGQPAADRRLQA